MRKYGSLLVAGVTLALLLSGCAKEQPAQTPPAGGADAAAQTVDKGIAGGAARTADAGTAAQAPEKAPEAAWCFEVTRETEATDYKSPDGTVVASVSYETPRLTLKAESGGDGAEPPEAMRAVCDAFNADAAAYDSARVWGTAWDMRAEGLAHYQAYRENGWEVFPLADELTITDVRQTDELVSVWAQAYVNLGGAHPDWGFCAWNFDLGTGSFFSLNDLTDRPEAMRAVLAEEIVSQIYRSELYDAFYDDTPETVRQQQDFNVFFGAEGMTVWFGEYEIAPHVAGVPTFEIPYAVFASFLNARGERLLALSEEERVLGDFYDAERLWYWFEGAAPVDYEDAEAVPVAAADGTTMELSCHRFSYPGVTTMAQLRALLATRFSDALVAEKLDAGGFAGPLFREIGGALYVVDAGRGDDLTVASVDYAVDLANHRVVATIARQDFDDNTLEWVLTGVTEEVAFPYEAGPDGARFTDFQSIY